MSVDFHAEIDYALDATLTLDARIEVEATSLSGIYCKVDFAEDTDRSAMREQAEGYAGPVEFERRYSLPAGSGPHVELLATAGATGAPVTVTVRGPEGIQLSAAGVTGQALAIETGAG